MSCKSQSWKADRVCAFCRWTWESPGADLGLCVPQEQMVDKVDLGIKTGETTCLSVTDGWDCGTVPWGLGKDLSFLFSSYFSLFLSVDTHTHPLLPFPRSPRAGQVIAHNTFLFCLNTVLVDEGFFFYKCVFIRVKNSVWGHFSSTVYDVNEGLSYSKAIFQMNAFRFLKGRSIKLKAWRRLGFILSL